MAVDRSGLVNPLAPHDAPGAVFLAFGSIAARQASIALRETRALIAAWATSGPVGGQLTIPEHLAYCRSGRRSTAA